MRYKPLGREPINAMSQYDPKQSLPAGHSVVGRVISQMGNNEPEPDRPRNLIGACIVFLSNSKLSLGGDTGIMTKTDDSSRPLGKAAVDAAERFCMIRGPRRVVLGGVGRGGGGLGVGIILAAGGSAGADQQVSPVPTCSSPASSSSPLIILDNQ